MKDNDTVTLTFPTKALAGLYYLANMGIISAELDSKIAKVELKSKEPEYINTYNAQRNDYRATLLDARSITDDAGTKTSIGLAFPLLDDIQQALTDAFSKAVESSDE